jgi:hypothetical protein
VTWDDGKQCPTKTSFGPIHNGYGWGVVLNGNDNLWACSFWYSAGRQQYNILKDGAPRRATCNRVFPLAAQGPQRLVSRRGHNGSRVPHQILAVLANDDKGAPPYIACLGRQRQSSPTALLALHGQHPGRPTQPGGGSTRETVASYTPYGGSRSVHKISTMEDTQLPRFNTRCRNPSARRSTVSALTTCVGGKFAAIATSHGPHYTP